MNPVQPSLYSVKYDLTNCEDEPLHIIGAVQSHACLLVCDRANKSILQASANTEEFVGIDYQDLIGLNLNQILSEQAIVQMMEGLEETGSDNLHFTFEYNFNQARKQGWKICICYFTRDFLMLEIEPLVHAMPYLKWQMEFSKTLHTLQRISNLQNILQETVDEVKKITGFEQIIAYQFDAEMNGKVVAEKKEAHLKSYLNLHYPAGDIPKQARALYVKNQVRFISDSYAEQIPILPVINPKSGQPADLTHSTVRGVSPIHLQYLQHMGMSTSMSIAIVRDNELWGLITCLNSTSKLVDFYQRRAVWFLGKILAMHIIQAEVKEKEEYTKQFTNAKAQLLSQLEKSNDSLLQAFAVHGELLLEMNEATGAVVHFDHKTLLFGETPDYPAVQELIRWCEANQKEDNYNTHELPKVYPPASAFTDKAAGLLSLKFSYETPAFIMWFKQERIKTIQWGKNVEVEYGPDKIELHPLNSFQKWKEQVSGKSDYWKNIETGIAGIFRREINALLIEKNVNKSKIKQLSEAYKELESFSYTVAHDMRGPLRNIHGFANILKESYSEKLNPEDSSLLNYIMESSERLDVYIQDMLAYSKLSHTDWNLEQMPVKWMIENTLQELLDNPKNKDRTIEIHLQEEIPPLMTNKTLFRQLIDNLLSNAFKYSGHSNPSVITIAAEAADGFTTLSIGDNGIGFDMNYADKIFEVFTRAVGDDEYEGTGVGLAIVKRIVLLHKGKIWVESAPGNGSTFFIRLPNGDEAPS